MNPGARPLEMTSPYRGLTPYTEDDYAYFFGRSQEIDTISANLEVARITLLYGPSGVGKSSVLRAGVVHDLGLRAQENLASGGVAEAIPVYFNRWQRDPVRGFAQSLAAAVQPYLRTEAAPPADASLLAQLQYWTRVTDSDLLLILDQFEEYFLYHDPSAEQDPAAFGG